MIKTVATEVVKTAPVIGAVWYNAAIAAIPVVIMLLTMVYISLQIGFLIYKWRKEIKNDKP